jgi:hypothetical protein
MTKTLLIILLILSQTAYSQKIRRSDSKAEKERMNRALRADIFGECYEDYYVYKDDGTIDTVYAPNWKRPDCFGMQIKKPVYRKTSMRKTPSQGKNQMKPPKNRPVMLMKAMTVKKLQLMSRSIIHGDGIVKLVARSFHQFGLVNLFRPNNDMQAV